MRRAQSNGARYKISDGITQGLLSDWVDCRQRAAYRCDGWRSGGRSDALEFGSLVHWLLEWYYTKGGPDAGDLFRVFQDGAHVWLSEAKQLGKNLGDVETDLAMARPLFLGYAEHWAKQDRGRKWIALEGVFEISYKTTRGFSEYLLRGRCDGAYEKNGLWLFETKTKSYLQEDSFTQALSFDWQNLFYILAKGKELGRTFSGVCYNIIRKCCLKQTKGETIQAFRERFAEDVKARPEFYFIRYEVAYPKARLEWAEKELEKKLALFEEWVHKGGPTFRNQAACCGKWNCSYLSACASGSMAGYERDKVFRFRELEENA